MIFKGIKYLCAIHCLLFRFGFSIFNRATKTHLQIFWMKDGLDIKFRRLFLIFPNASHAFFIYYFLFNLLYQQHRKLWHDKVVGSVFRSKGFNQTRRKSILANNFIGEVLISHLTFTEYKLAESTMGKSDHVREEGGIGVWGLEVMWPRNKRKVRLETQHLLNPLYRSQNVLCVLFRSQLWMPIQCPAIFAILYFTAFLYQHHIMGKHN